MARMARTAAGRARSPSFEGTSKPRTMGAPAQRSGLGVANPSISLETRW